MEHLMHPEHHVVMPGMKGVAILTLCVLLHITSVHSASGTYSMMALLQAVRHFGLDGLVQMGSGLASMLLAIIMGRHYWLRNKALKRELEDGKKSDTEKEEEESDGK
jgi:hypothetical protein